MTAEPADATHPSASPEGPAADVHIAGGQTPSCEMRLTLADGSRLTGTYLRNLVHGPQRDVKTLADIAFVCVIEHACADGEAVGRAHEDEMPLDAA